MIADILTCVGTSVVGLGVGLVINTIRKKRKRKADEMPSSIEKPKGKKIHVEENLLLTFGLQSYFNTLEKYIRKNDKEEHHAFVSLQKYMRRILQLAKKSEDDAAKSRFWNCTGAIAANATNVKLWIRTLNHIFEDRYNKHVPEELIDTLQYFLDYLSADQYNRLKEMGS